MGEGDDAAAGDDPDAPPATVRGLVDRAAAAHPRAVYARATESGAQLDYAGLRDACGRLAAWLDVAGVPAGGTVALVMPNGLQTLRLALGTMAAGRCVCPVNLLAQAEQMRYVLQHSDASLVFAAPDWADRVGGLCRDIGRPLRIVVADPDAPQLAEVEAVAPADAPLLPAADAPALLMYTSGTTGVPKGVRLTQAALAANARSISREHALGGADRVLAVLPLYHINGFVVTMLSPLVEGGGLAVAPKFSASRFWAQAEASGATWINVVPTIVAVLLDGEDAPPACRQRIRFCRSASAPLPPEHLRAFEQRFGIGVIETMGLTETGAPSFSNPLDPARRKLGSVGRASGGEACILGPDLRPLPDGQTGELAIRGPHVMSGYYKNDAATQAAFTPDGWLRTGDLGHRDADGFFFVTGRLKELIIKGGENIAPREIDEVLLRHPAVADAAAVGIPDRHYGQEVAACAVLRAGAVADEALLREFCVQHLGRYKAPCRILLVDELPRGPSGKVQRLKLAQRFEPPPTNQ